MSESASKSGLSRGANQLASLERIKAQKEEDERRKQEAIRIAYYRNRERRKLSMPAKMFIFGMFTSFAFFGGVLMLSYIPGYDRWAFQLIDILVVW